MATKGLGLFAEADKGWTNHLKSIFKNSGIAVGTYAVAHLKLVTAPKEKMSEKGNKVSVDRLRYQLHTEVPPIGGAILPGLIAAGDEVHVVWIGHGGYVTQDDKTKKSWKFAPHHGTDGPQAHMSAKELARAIHAVCRTSQGDAIYPKSLTIISCYSGQPRQLKLRQRVTVEGKASVAVITSSTSENCLAWRVLQHLHAMFDPVPGYTCTVAGPEDDVMGMQIPTLKVPITITGWTIGKL